MPQHREIVTGLQSVQTAPPNPSPSPEGEASHDRNAESEIFAPVADLATKIAPPTREVWALKKHWKTSTQPDETSNLSMFPVLKSQSDAAA
jgi:hypothetical protein